MEPEPGRDDLGFVDDQQIARYEELDEVADVAMSGWRVAAIDEETSRVARLDRVLGDARLG